MVEIWKETKGWPYLVSNLGRVRRCGEKKMLSNNPSPNGYINVHLHDRGRIRSVLVHRLVADAFLGQLPRGLVTNHKDGDKSNNQVSNLEFITNQENMKHATEHGLRPRGELHHNSKLTTKNVIQIKCLLESGKTYRSIARKYHVVPSNIASIDRGATWRHVTT